MSMTKEQIRKQYKLAMFRSGAAHTTRETRRWAAEAARLKLEYESFDDDFVEPPVYRYKRRVLPRRDILNTKTPGQIRAMLDHFLAEKDKLRGAVYRGVRLQHMIGEHCAKLRAILRDKTTAG